MNETIAAVDIGFVSTGIAYAQREGEHIGVAGVVISTESVFSAAQKKRVRVADQLVDRVIALLDGLDTELGILHAAELSLQSSDLRGVLIEMPTGGSKSGAAARGMGISIAIAAHLKRSLRCPVEIYIPTDVRKKVIHRQHMPRKMTTTKGGKLRMESQTKEAVRASVLKRFHFDEASMATIPKRKREHVYDASAVLVAARDESLIRSLGWPRSIFEEGAYDATRSATASDG